MNAIQLNHLKLAERDDKITQEAYEFFSGTRSGHIGYLMYGSPLYNSDPVKGEELWAALRHEPSYYITREDDAALALAVEAIGKMNIASDVMIDLGPGAEESLFKKSIPLCQSIQANRYVAVDTCASYAKKAAATVAQHTSMQTSSLVADFFSSSLGTKEPNALLFMGGSTIANAPIDGRIKSPLTHLSAVLKRLRGSVQDTGYLLLGFDSNQNPETINKAYSNETNASFVESALWHIARDADVGLDPRDFQYHGEWLADEHRYSHNMKARNDCMVRVADTTFYFEAGEKLHVSNSYKFPIELMQRAAQSAGWEPAGTWSIAGRASYLLLKACS